MVAAFFFYYNYKFSTYKFVDFNKITLYTKSDIFEPKKDTYYLLIFSSKISDLNSLIKKIPKDEPILAIDIFQQRKQYPKITYTTAGINTIINLNIYEDPVVAKIKRYHKNFINKIVQF